jgi:hypothetical protein
MYVNEVLRRCHAHWLLCECAASLTWFALDEEDISCRQKPNHVSHDAPESFVAELLQLWPKIDTAFRAVVSWRLPWSCCHT